MLHSLGEQYNKTTPPGAKSEFLELTRLFLILRDTTNPEVKEQATSNFIEALRISRFRGGPSVEEILCQYDRGIPGVSRAYLVQLNIVALVQGLYSHE